MSCSKQISAISFEEVVGGHNANVRKTQDEFIYAVDLAMAMTGASQIYASQVKTPFTYFAILGNSQ